jgi:glycosyltransferase involved in cell wall biosynthesis/GT2 family glycosyltransferase
MDLKNVNNFTQRKVGIVIVSHNASLAVRVTLASLRQAKNVTPFEVVLVDNASNPVERAAIRHAFERHVIEGQLRWHYIQLEENLGFAGGNNVGIRMFLEDDSISHICLLNSDVIVTDYWLDRLIEKGCDMVSPVTNKADGVQWVPADYDVELNECLDPTTESIVSIVFDKINSFAQNWFKAWRDNVVPVEATTFCCVLLSKELVRKVGLLDTNFFPGGYEDDDYCIRVRSLDVDIHLARDVFIHHWGSASFGQLQREYFNANALRNRKYLEKKHKIVWKSRPHAPILSFAQDVVFALAGRGELAFQWRYLKLYIETLTKLLAHYHKEFISLQSLMQSSKCSIPTELEQELERVGVLNGRVMQDWHNIVQEIRQKMERLPCKSTDVDSISKKLTTLADIVYAIGMCNVKMSEVLRERHAMQPVRPMRKLAEAVRTILKGVTIFRKIRGVVFFGGYPYPEREMDGYFQRIRMVDSLFNNCWRIYIEHVALPGKNTWYDSPAQHTLVLRITGSWIRKWLVRLCVILCVLRCRVIYFHSVLRMRESGFGYLMWLPGIIKIIDVHGAVPEEFRYHGDPIRARIYEKYERLAVRKADYIIVVSEAMKRHLEGKYKGSVRGKFIVIPNIPEVTIDRSEKHYIDGKPVVIYAGGLHKWQQVPKMIEAISKQADKCLYRLFCPEPDKMQTMLPEKLRFNSNIQIDSKPHKELIRIYSRSHYGFVLRENHVINRVACPTKLVEYIAMGVVPIVECEDIGDFKRLGMKYIRLQEFVDGCLPDEATRNCMAQNNLAVYEKLIEIYRTGATSLQRALEGSYSSRRNLTMIQGVKWMRQHLPPDTLVGLVARRVWRIIKRVKGANRQSRKNETMGQGSRFGGTSLPPCDILVQVGNFQTGGLENVVLEINEALMEAGWRVGLLVLGIAGAAVERARHMGIPVCVMRFEPLAYRTLLQTVTPKLVIAHYSIEGAAICAKLNIPLIQVIHNTYVWFSDAQVREFSEAASYTKAFIAVSDFVRDYSTLRLGVPWEKCFVIPNGINVGAIRRLDFAAERRKLRAKFGFTEDDFVFLNVGSVNHQKNHIGLVRAFHKALPNCLQAKLVILGPAYEPELLEAIEHYVRQHGLEQDIIYAGETADPYPYYAMADAFVASSFFEGGQLVLLEALAANLPVVTTEVGFASVFRNQKGIILIPPPVNIFTYRGPIWELHSTPEFETNLATAIQRTYAERIRPDLADDVVEMFDKRYTYKLYVNLVKQLLENEQIPLQLTLPSWPSALAAKKAASKGSGE